MTVFVTLRYNVNAHDWHSVSWPGEGGLYDASNPWNGLGESLQTFATSHAFSVSGRYEMELTSEDSLVGTIVNVYDREMAVVRSVQTLEGNALRLVFERPLLEDSLGWAFFTLRIQRLGHEPEWWRVAPLAIAIPKGKLGSALEAMTTRVRQHYGTYLALNDVTLSMGSVSQDRRHAMHALLVSLNDLLGPFRACAKRQGVMIEEEGPAEKLNGVHAQTLRHLVMHPEHLTPAAIQTGVRVGQGHYLPRRTLNTKIVSSFDSEAHRQLLGFLKVVAQSLEEDYAALLAYGAQLDSTLPTPTVHPPSHAASTEVSALWWFREAKKANQSQESDWAALASQAQMLAQQYASILSMPLDSIVPLRGLPEPNAQWWSHWVYQSLYNVMMRWFSLWEPSLGHMLQEERQLMIGMEMSEVYEHFLLVKMLSTLQERGYTLVKKEAFDYETREGPPNHHNTFVWEKLGLKVTVYSEPIIRMGAAQANGIGLTRVSRYSLDDNRQMQANYARDAYYSPDMVVAIQEGAETEWFIYDAKLSVPKTVVSYYGSSLIYKYMFGLLGVDPTHSVRDVTILCGKPMDSTDAMPFVAQEDVGQKQRFRIEADIPGSLEEEAPWITRMKAVLESKEDTALFEAMPDKDALWEGMPARVIS